MTPPLTRALNQFANAALTFFYPDICQNCYASPASKAEGYICSECWRNIRFIVPPLCNRCGLPYAGEIGTPFECSNCREMNLKFSHARSAVAAQGMVLDVIHRWKYQRALWFGPFLAGLLVREAAAEIRSESWNLLVPVPLHPQKEKEREFNQALHLATHLGQAIGVPVAHDVIRRTAPTRTQTLLSRPQRTENMRHAFSSGRGEAKAKGRRIVLIDDVLTTGATTSACARLLLASGAEEVCVWTVARGLLH